MVSNWKRRCRLLNAGSIVLWVGGMLLVGFDRPVRVGVAMVMIVASLRLMDKAIHIELYKTIPRRTDNDSDKV